MNVVNAPAEMREMLPLAQREAREAFGSAECFLEKRVLNPKHAEVQILGDKYGGLGFFIFEGYHRNFPTEIFAGAVPSILLALAADLVLVRVQARITPWTSPPEPIDMTTVGVPAPREAAT